MAKKSEATNDSEKALEELRQIKLLLLAGLIKDGVKQNDLAALLGVSTGKLSGMLPRGKRSFRPAGTS